MVHHSEPADVRRHILVKLLEIPQLGQLLLEAFQVLIEILVRHLLATQETKTHI